MQKLAEGLHKKGCVKKYDKVLERIGRIKQKNPKASKQYKITVEKDDKSGKATLITWKHAPKTDTKDKFPGVYCLTTCPVEAISLIRKPEDQIDTPPSDEIAWYEKRAQLRGVDISQFK